MLWCQKGLLPLYNSPRPSRCSRSSELVLTAALLPNWPFAFVTELATSADEKGWRRDVNVTRWEWRDRRWTIGEGGAKNFNCEGDQTFTFHRIGLKLSRASGQGSCKQTSLAINRNNMQISECSNEALSRKNTPTQKSISRDPDRLSANVPEVGHFYRTRNLGKFALNYARCRLTAWKTLGLTAAHDRDVVLYQPLRESMSRASLEHV
ncbi:uncharacterized protein MYCFIDRAFT_178281 [Pseudocercospora fijiensis CIRAD86]|uniref:Uncharacterized protein n=1 Tax=Pseudocercospora fijiensis (strain CIRAD86) TaxID=383855 RepID=M3ARM7_PSEFD|nr:uncharacterized protein MYCFIDRAFT_178281 [Pseudocercospora fijiensis CIRAD86]EME79713.1 hypothetical protein MYCFIDRAFT_178281 [Pseudocercospora fijiensis CIRAD86]